jgi:hypothetical protein
LSFIDGNALAMQMGEPSPVFLFPPLPFRCLCLAEVPEYQRNDQTDRSEPTDQDVRRHEYDSFEDKASIL